VRRVDVALFRAINGMAGHWPPLDMLMIALANGLPLLATALLTWLWFGPAGPQQRRHRRVTVVLAVLAVLLAMGSTDVPGLMFFRPRPFITLRKVTVLVAALPSNSFPSGHLAGSAGLVAALPYRSARWAAVMWALVWGSAYARVYVGVHYPADVVAGLVAGWLAGATVRYNRTVLTAFAERVVGSLQELI
jgi:undecaprenyl-diphosphatase